MKKRSGFSLMEVIVVIAIIAIVASLMFPVFSQARIRAKETVCLSNLKQIYTAAKLYQDTYGDYPPDGDQTIIQSQYLGNAQLKCFAQKDTRFKWDYHVHGPVTHAPPSVPNGIKMVEQCRERRGGEFPVVSDANHIDVVTGYQSGRRFYLIARENGSIGTVNAKRFEDMLGGLIPAPCDIQLSVLNL